MKKASKKARDRVTYVAVALIFVLFVALLLSPKLALKPAAITSISEVKYGQIKDGKLVGAKYLVHATLGGSLEDTILLQLKGSEISFGDYKVSPQKNLLIKLKNQGSYAVSPVKPYLKEYYKYTFGSAVLQLQAVQGDIWSYHTPYIVNIYADSNSVPTTLVSSKYVSEIGQAWTPVSDNGIAVQQISIAFIGPQGLPGASEIIVATAPAYDDLVSKTKIPYQATTYIFDKSSYDSQMSYFYTNYGDRLGLILDSPAMVLWTGYDKYTLLSLANCGYVNQKDGYCKLDDIAHGSWGGLYRQVSKPSYDITFDPRTNNIRANNIQYGAEVNIEIPSEIVESLAILRGVGVPEIIDIVAPDTIRQGEYKQLAVVVRNNGDIDGFNIQPISKSGELIFTPNSYTSYQINAGEQIRFPFQISVAGKETSYDTKEDITIEVRALHNPTKATKSITIGVERLPLPPGQPTVKPTEAGVLPPSGEPGKDTSKAWYEMWQVWAIIGLILAAVYLVYEENKKSKKQKRG